MRMYLYTCPLRDTGFANLLVEESSGVSNAERPSMSLFAVVYSWHSENCLVNFNTIESLWLGIHLSYFGDNSSWSSVILMPIFFSIES